MESQQLIAERHGELFFVNHLASGCRAPLIAEQSSEDFDFRDIRESPANGSFF
ncbi:MAG: hypothetical protein ACI3ZQ_04940 [Candidatus Cryptobacteroides sp.]